MGIIFKEPMGKLRLKEALEANDWEANDLDDDFDLDALDEEDEGSVGFGMEATELEMEMFGMKRAVRGTAGDEVSEDDDSTAKEATEEKEEDVEQLESMMMRLQAVRGKFPPSNQQF